MIKLFYLLSVISILFVVQTIDTQIDPSTQAYLYGPCGIDDLCFSNGTCLQSLTTQRQYCKCNATQKNSFACSMTYESTVSTQVSVKNILASSASSIKASTILQLSQNASISWDQIDQIFTLIQTKASTTKEIPDLEKYFQSVDYLIVRISGESDMTDLDIKTKQNQTFSVINQLAYRAIQLQQQQYPDLTHYSQNLSHYSVLIAPWQTFIQTDLPNTNFNNSNIQFPVCKYNAKSILIKVNLK